MKKLFDALFSIYNIYIPAIALIAIFTIFAYINVSRVSNSINNDGQIINQSGKQRMFSQNLIILGMHYLEDPSEENRVALESGLIYMRSIHDELVSLQKNKEISSFYAECDLCDRVHTFLDGFDHFLYNPTREYLLELSRESQALLPTLSELVAKYEELNRQKISALEDTQYYVLMMVVIILLLELVFVFYPINRRIKRQTLELKSINETLERRVALEVEKSRQKDRQLAQSTKLAQMGEMIDMIAHQWRQPLNSIASINSKIEFDILLNQRSDEKTLANTALISEIIRYLSHTIDDFREFFKSSNKKVKCSSKEMIQSVLNIVSNSTRSQNIEILLEPLGEEDLLVYANDLKQVLLSIISNAIYVLNAKQIKDPRIVISSRTLDDKSLELKISDNGGGIDEEHLDRIFEQNFTTKEADGGSGLGLYICKIIVEEHLGGKLFVSNEQDGAVFTILIPL